MDGSASCRRVVIVDNDVSAEEARFLTESGFIVKRVDSVESILQAHHNAAISSACIKNSEQELDEARALAERRAAELQSFVTSMTEGIVLIDSNLNILLANEGIRKLLGPPANLPMEMWIRKYQLRTLQGEPVYYENWPTAKALKGEVTVNARFRMVTPWKESIVSMSGAPVRDSRGQVIGAALSVHDISDLIAYERLQEDLFQREHYIADMLQQALVPQQIPYQIGGFSIAGRYQAALDEAQVGGDFYDIFELGRDKIGVLIGDVAGKGLTAAIRVASAKHAIRSYAYLDLNPSDVITLANNALCRENLACEDSMLTAFFAIVDLTDGSLIYTNGGHEPPIVYGNGRETEELDAAGGIPLGIFDDAMYGEVQHQLYPGDTILLLTDGITEARSNNILYGKESVISHIINIESHSPELTADSLLEAATIHAEGQLQDDAAVLVLRFDSP